MLNARWIVIEGFRIEMAAGTDRLSGDRRSTIARRHRCDRRRAARHLVDEQAGFGRSDEQLGACGPLVGELDRVCRGARRREAAFCFFGITCRAESIASTGPT